MKKIVLWLILILIAVVTVLFVYNDAFLYNKIDDTVIVKILSVDNTFSHEEEGPNGENEKYYDQNITAKIINGDDKGKEITLNNFFTESGVNDEKYAKGDQLIVSTNFSGDGGSIMGKKRDTYVALFFVMFMLMLILVSYNHGIVILVSFII